MPTKIVVVGGVAAGASAATKARRTDEFAEIVLFERGSYVSFANCGLPYYLGGDIAEVGQLLVVSQDLLSRRFRLDVRPNQEVLRIDVEGKRVEVRRAGAKSSYWESYDKLIIAPGGRPVRPPIPGIDLPGVHTLTAIPDAEAIKSFVLQNPVAEAVVVGGGFIGVEAAEALRSLGLQVHLLEMLPQVLPPFDPEMAAIVAEHLRLKEMALHLGAQVTRFAGERRLEGVELANGSRIKAGLAIVAIGVAPDLMLARQAGLTLGTTGGVVVDDHMRTSVPDIYACGDIVESTNLLTGRKVRVPLAGPANKQGRVAGANAAGGDMRFKGLVGTLVVKACDVTAAKAGLSEREARALGIEHFSSFTHSLHHAGYFPGATSMEIKLVVEEPTGRVIGAQIVGGDGVDKRIDILATAMYAGLTVEDLENLDLAYAPPYSSAKDPAIIAGFVAANVHRGEVKAITPDELNRLVGMGEALQLVDVRSPGEYLAGHIGEAILSPLDDLRGSLDDLDRTKRTVVYCKAGYRSYHAYKILTSNGFVDVANLSGGYDAWKYTREGK